jgi:hypothetical protein
MCRGGLETSTANSKDVAKWTKVHTMIFPTYELLTKSYAKAQEVEKLHGQFDSQRAAKAAPGQTRARTSDRAFSRSLKPRKLV